jgi:hypothetical protein
MGEDTGEDEGCRDAPSLCLSPTKGREDLKPNAAVLLLPCPFDSLGALAEDGG